MTGFDDGKDDGALRTIGEVSEALGIKPHVLRYWEAQFPLLKPLKRSGGRRYYRAADIEMVQTIDRLVNREGYTLKGAEAVLRAAAKSALDRRKDDRRGGDRRVDADDGELPGVRLMVSEAPEMTEVIAGLKAVRARLAAALGA
ncbi:MerR family transcriptional regulator [Porphyrobacter sp. ULC335]|jgi:DNA-binding transcriptional MerR regulator|uniref:MerR family transcriptional regulator n=1 Tax=Porphyrobacter sp. ULC335 TaxID=2854260 RepID=UPI0022202694|nr:MerR family transcriptional regulator [Porphyrobacter sp. ULC335]UYV15253.1 MerR family transcriptional regulator [Porphyrobacter sp. ULC335]